MASASRHVLLLRGVNVGGKNRLQMSALVDALEGLGASRVRTYIQSGNAAFDASRAVAARVASELAAVLHDAHGINTPVVLRTADELADVVESNPLLAEGVPPEQLHVVFLAETPAPFRLARLDPARSPPDRFVARGRELYFAFPNGVARTRFTNTHLDFTLGTLSTLRNWRTVLALLALARG